MTARIVTPEILDGLPATSPSAMRSRRDLRRVHRAMGTRRIVVQALRSTQICQFNSTRLRVLEIGAGDGQLMRKVAQTLQAKGRAVEMTLLDQMALVEPATIALYAEVGWQVTSVVGDVLAWAADAKPFSPDNRSDQRWDLIIANLFLHHFDGSQLAALLAAIKSRTQCFVACEPHRSAIARLGSHLIGALGVNVVTRSDAVSSVAAGFRESELTDLWPGAAGEWKRQEYAAGLFSHCFIAERRTPTEH